MSSSAGLGVGFGLFAVLSIVRLRSEALSYVEVAYFFAALALGVVNGLAPGDVLFMLLLNALLLGGMVVLERVPVGRGVRQQRMLIDEVFADEQGLRGDLERRVGGEVLGLEVLEVDYVNDTTRVEVTYRLGAGGDEREPPIVLRGAGEAADQAPAGPAGRERWAL